MAMASDPAIHGGKKAGTLVVVVMKAVFFNISGNRN